MADTGKLKLLLLGKWSRKRMVTDLILIPVLVYCGVIIYGLLRSEKMIFVPHPPEGDYEQTFAFPTGNGLTLRGRYIQNPEADLTILYSHGNAEDLNDIEPWLHQLSSWGFSVFSYDYQGYGLSDGKPSVKKACRDAEAAYAYLTGQLEIAPEKIILYGRSLGGGPTTHLAAHFPAAALVLQSTFMSAYRVMTKYPIVPFDKFQNLRLLKYVHVPVLTIHGTSDDVIPFYHGEGLYTAAKPPKDALWLQGAGHNFMSDEQEEGLRKKLLEFTGTVARTQDSRLTPPSN